MNEAFLRSVEEKKIEYTLNADLKQLSTFRVGGTAPIVIFPACVDELVTVLKLVDKTQTKVRLVGRGSNTLFGDGEISSALIVTKNMNSISQNDDVCIVCESGASLHAAASFAAERGLCGFEFASGIPGTVGGAMYMNAGAYGEAMSDVVLESLAYDTESDSIVSLRDHGFGYRRSVYMSKGSLVCLSVTLKLSSGDRGDIKDKMARLSKERREKQPLEYPSCGSYFKRPEGHFAGRLIEDCGLKGFSVGGAEISEKHAGFIINKGGATAADILALEKEVKRRVFARFGVALEREVEYVD